MLRKQRVEVKHWLQNFWLFIAFSFFKKCYLLTSGEKEYATVLWCFIF